MPLRIRSVVLASIVACLAALVAASPAEAAQRASKSDPASTNVPATHDIRRIAMSVSDTKVVLTTTLRKVKKKGDVQVYTELTDGRGAPNEIAVWRIQGKPRSSVHVSINLGEREKVSCPGLRQKWRTKARTVTVAVPLSCLSATSFYEAKFVVGRIGALEGSDMATLSLPFPD